MSDSGDTENIPNHSTTKKKRSEFDWCCCSLFFIFQISPTYSFIGKKSSKSTNVRKRRKQRKAASAHVSKSPIGKLPIAVVVPHKNRAQALVTNLTASNATAKERAIEEIFAEGGKVTTKSNQWARVLKLVTADQRKLLAPARAKRLSDVRAQVGRGQGRYNIR